MPTDLQASTSSTSTISNQTSLEDCYGLDKSRDEMDLCREMTALSNGFVHSRSCCTPLGMTCLYEEEALERAAADRCKVVCSNSNCDQSGWIHVVCLKTWEQKLKADVLKLYPQMRISIDRQKGINHWIDVLQNVMPSSFVCPCNQGTMKQSDKNINCGSSNGEISYFSGQQNANRRKIGSNNQITNQSSFNFSNNGSIRKNSLENNSPNSFNNYTKRLRSRTLSANQMVLNFTSDPHVISPTDFPKTKKDLLSVSMKQQACTKLANGLMAQKNKSHNRQRHHSSSYHGSNSTTKEDSSSSNIITTNSAGNIFKQRSDFQTFQKLPLSKQNAYFIQMEDDSCTGNDDTKVFLLTLLSKHGVNMAHCLICSSKLPIYDHLPIVDGTFFLSPLSHSAGRSIPISASSHPPGSIGASIMNSSSSYQHSSQQREKYLHVICIHCMHEIVICCQFCHRPWTGAQLLIGSLYTYDIFAAVPCCLNRLSCNNCNGLCIDISNCSSPESNPSKSLTPSLSTLLSNFSQLSRLVECKNCHNRDYHFVKPFAEIYKPIGSYI